MPLKPFARRVLAVAFATVIVFVPPVSTAAADPARVAVGGELDRSFGTGGHALGPPALQAVYAAVVVQPDGKIAVVGNGGLADDRGVVREGGIVVLRFTGDGTLDETFGDGGVVLTHFADRVRRASALAFAPAGGLVVAGSAVDGEGRTDLTVMRLTPGGALDPTFAGGVVTTDVGPYDAALSVAVTPDDRVVVASVRWTADVAAPDGAAFLVRYTAAGALDPSFGDAGIADVLAIRTDTFIRAFALVAPDGGLVAVACSRGAFGDRTWIARLDAAGRMPGPVTSVEGLVQDVAFAPDGGMVANGIQRVAGDPYSGRAVLMRWRADGFLDAEFGDSGVRAVSERGTPGSALAIDDRGRIVLAGWSLLRRLPDGSADPAFGIGGEAPASIAEEYGDVVLQGDGKIVAAGGGYHRGGPNGALALETLVRYASDASRLCGDADASETLTVSDGVAVLRAAAGLGDSCTRVVCDVDGSGALGVTDGVLTLRAAAGLPGALRCGGP